MGKEIRQVREKVEVLVLSRVVRGGFTFEQRLEEGYGESHKNTWRKSAPDRWNSQCSHISSRNSKEASLDGGVYRWGDKVRGETGTMSYSLGDHGENLAFSLSEMGSH